MPLELMVKNKTRENPRFSRSRKFKKFSRKSEAGLVIILLVVIVILFFGWIINISQRECKSNRDCGAEAYCGSDFSCHAYPSIQKTVVKYNLLVPSIVIGMAIIIVAIIFKWSQISNKEESKIPLKESVAKKQEEEEDIGEPYYKSDIE